MYGSWQASLFAGDTIEIDRTFGGIERVELDRDSWIDHRPGWLGGADDLFGELVTALPWRQRDVVMWDRLLPEPRLTWWWDETAATPEPLAILAEIRTALSQRYQLPFASIGCNWYRDGRDSVAWHRDKDRQLAQPVVAIVSVGAPRKFLVRRFGGGPSRSFLLGHGDLLVMGGRCQHEWEHTVPKVARAGPRISITMRHHRDDFAPGDLVGPVSAGSMTP